MSTYLIPSLLEAAEKLFVHPSTNSEPVLSLTKERTEEPLKSFATFRSAEALEA